VWLPQRPFFAYLQFPQKLLPGQNAWLGLAHSIKALSIDVTWHIILTFCYGLFETKEIPG
jgi:hypothetical protein